ncbi:MAG: hypothetical protein HPY61_13425 [Methanotrichaceae archaeon]|nr:hypothetical protein [Methanotrichaceae archaeon]
MTEKNYQAWEVKESDYPLEGSTEDRLKFLLHYAILAPSGPNTQPWKFAISTNTISIYADLSRSLPFVDPSNRTLFMSVGCAIANLMVAGRHFGFKPRISFFPRGLESELVAEAKFERNEAPPEEEDDLFPQITRRYTIKHKFDDKPVDPAILEDLSSCLGPGFHLIYMTKNQEKEEMASLVTRAHHIQLADRNFRHNLGVWLRSNRTSDFDGMPLYTFGVPDWVAMAFPAVFREFDLSEAVIHRDSGLIRGCSAMAVLASDRDDRQAWTECGLMLERLFLRATSYDVRLSFFSQPIGLPELRQELALKLKQSFPQLLFGLGYSTPVKHTPRRPLDEVLIAQ